MEEICAAKYQAKEEWTKSCWMNFGILTNFLFLYNLLLTSSSKIMLSQTKRNQTLGLVRSTWSHLSKRGKDLNCRCFGACFLMNITVSHSTKHADLAQSTVVHAAQQTVWSSSPYSLPFHQTGWLSTSYSCSGSTTNSLVFFTASFIYSLPFHQTGWLSTSYSCSRSMTNSLVFFTASFIYSLPFHLTGWLSTSYSCSRSTTNSLVFFTTSCICC